MNRHSKSTTISTWLAAALAIGLVVGGGALYGSYSQRWGPPADMVAMGRAVEEMPRQIGDWEMVSESPMDKSAIEMLECTGYINRQYRHQKTGQTVNLAVLVGPPGPIAVHTPEVCFSSRAYEQKTQRQNTAMTSSPSGTHTFWCLDFDTKNVLANKLRVYYAWSVGPEWVASEKPRYEFAAAPALYKIQLAAEIPPGSANEQEDAGRAFLEALVDSNWRLGLSPDTRANP